MQESFPNGPSLFFGLVLPSRPKYFLLNLWIANPHTATPKALVHEDVSRLCSRDDAWRNQYVYIQTSDYRKISAIEAIHSNPSYSFLRTARAISGSRGRIAEYFSHNL
jgi:hypothetical protein